MSEDKARLKFIFREAFPSTSRLGRFAATIAMISNDLTQTNNTLLEKIKAAEADKAAERLFFFWVGASQYREAVKFIEESLREKDIQEFMKSLPKEAQEIFIKIRESYEPWNDSFVKKVAKPIRDDLFHYPKTEDERWEETLTDLADKEGSVLFLGQRRLMDVRAEFADDIRSLMLAKWLGVALDDMEKSMAVFADLFGYLIRLTHEIINAYFATLKKGILHSDTGPS